MNLTGLGDNGMTLCCSCVILVALGLMAGSECLSRLDKVPRRSCKKDKNYIMNIISCKNKGNIYVVNIMIKIIARAEIGFLNWEQFVIRRTGPFFSVCSVELLKYERYNTTGFCLLTRKFVDYHYDYKNGWILPLDP